jgi:mRNA-degrading endonuclease RelE of RelBE toxin-antitoxin system
MRELFVTRQFQKDILRIPSDIRIPADVAIERLRKNPADISLKPKKLVKITPVAYRVRIGHYRLIFSFTKTTLTLHKFRHRKDIYRKL